MNFFKNRQRGITFIEMAMSLAVLSIILATLTFNHRSFTDKLEITNLAYDIALTIREAQVSGAAVRGTGLGGFDRAFGVHFNISDHQNFEGNEKAFLLFVDLDNDEIYNYPSGNTGFDCEPAPECIQRIDIGRGNEIDKICRREDNSIVCSTNPSGVDITFLRPKLDAHIRFRNRPGRIMEEHNDKEAIICLKSPQERRKTIHILPTGQISISDEEC